LFQFSDGFTWLGIGRQPVPALAPLRSRKARHAEQLQHWVVRNERLYGKAAVREHPASLRRFRIPAKEAAMQVSDAMTRDVRVANAGETIAQAALLMAKLDAGVLPVGENNRLVGMITDRDIAVRAVAHGKGPDTSVREVMTKDVKYCFADQEIDEVTRNMGDIQVRRLPVVDRNKLLVGILSLGDVAVTTGDGAAGEALSSISRAGGAYTQTG
jgi:CBS domain-containing protein